MFVFFVDRWDGSPASTDLRSGQRVTRVIDAESDTPGITGVNVIGILASLATDAVYKGAAHPQYPFARCVSIDAQPSGDDPCLWTVTAVYEEPAPTYGDGTIYPGDDPGGSDGGGPSTSNPEPHDRPPVLKVTYRKFDEYRAKDLGNFKFENFAGDRYDSPPPIPRTHTLVRFTVWKEADAWTPLVGQGFIEKVNSGAWQGFAAGTCAVIGLEAERKEEKGRLFWQLDYTIEVHGQNPANIATSGADAYKIPDDKVPYANMLWVPQYGYNAYTTANSPATKEEIVGPGNKPLASPAKLNADGTVRAADSDPLVKEHQFRDTISFAGL